METHRRIARVNPAPGRRFSQEVLDTLIGSTSSLDVPEHRMSVTITAADCSPDGLWADIELETEVECLHGKDHTRQSSLLVVPNVGVGFLAFPFK